MLGGGGGGGSGMRFNPPGKKEHTPGTSTSKALEPPRRGTLGRGICIRHSGLGIIGRHVLSGTSVFVLNPRPLQT